MSMVTWTKDRLQRWPKPGTWVTSTCQIIFGNSPGEFTLNAKVGRKVGQCVQEWTISRADSLGMWNWYLKAVVFCWWRAREARSSVTVSVAIDLVRASAKSFTRLKGPCRLKWARICPISKVLFWIYIGCRNLDSKWKMVVLFLGSTAVSIWENSLITYCESE